MTVRALRYQLDTYHLDSTGRREVILKRLLQHLSSGAHPSPATGGNDSTASSSSAQRQPPDPSGSDDGESASASDSSESEDPQLPDTESTPGSSESEHEQPSRTSAHRHRSRERRSRHFRKSHHRRKRQSSSAHQHPRHRTVPDDITHLADLAHHHPLQAVPHTGAVLADDTALALVTQPPVIAEVTGAADIITITLVPAIHHHHAI